jgi:hypothetical protein
MPSTQRHTLEEEKKQKLRTSLAYYTTPFIPHSPFFVGALNEKIYANDFFCLESRGKPVSIFLFTKQVEMGKNIIRTAKKRKQGIAPWKQALYLQEYMLSTLL